jgi:hypothetical protein
MSELLHRSWDATVTALRPICAGVALFVRATADLTTWLG